MKNKLKIKIKPLAFLDLINFKNLIPKRKANFMNASAASPEGVPPMNRLAQELHPAKQRLVIAEVIEEAPDVKTFKLVPEDGDHTPAYFRAGQYLSLTVDVNGVAVTRPYSIASSPAEALNGYYTITIKKQENGFVTDHAFNNWDKGVRLETSGPEGQFYYERLRDMKSLVGIAGGSGITPFMSMLRQFSREGYPVDFTLFYGCNSREEVLFYEELKMYEAESGGRCKTVYVLLNPQGMQDAEAGYITAQIIQKYVDPEQCSFFICGPQAMYEFVQKELDTFSLPQKQIRREIFGEIKSIRSHKDYPRINKDSFALTVTINGRTVTVPALANESLLVSMERAGLNPPAKCRSGVCTFCRSKLLKGSVFVPDNTDGRRSADKKYSYVHACTTYPLSDIELRIT